LGKGEGRDIRMGEGETHKRSGLQFFREMGSSLRNLLRFVNQCSFVVLDTESTDILDMWEVNKAYLLSPRFF
jgi:hypothetical protein